jgi:hypothetical protein
MIVGESNGAGHCPEESTLMRILANLVMDGNGETSKKTGFHKPLRYANLKQRKKRLLWISFF